MRNAKRSSLVSILILSIFAFTFSISASADSVHLDWVRNYDSVYEGARDVAVDAAGNAYIVGHEYSGPEFYNIWLRKYDPAGNALWSRTYDGDYHGEDWGYGITADESGNVYVAGNIQVGRPGGYPNEYNMWLRKYDTNGNTLWTRTYDNPNRINDAAYSVSLDSDGNVYAVGTDLIKYDADGNFAWAIDTGGLGVAVDPEDKVYVTGDMGSDIFLRKYDTNGVVLWMKTYDSPAGNHDSGSDVAVDLEGNAFVVGYEYRNDLGDILQNGEEYNIWLRKYDTNGNTLWTETHDCLGNNDKGYSVDVDTMGNVYITGSEQANFVYPDIIVRKYDGEGNTLWTTTFGDPDGGIDIGYGIAVDSMNNVFVAGDMDNIENNGWDKDILLLKYSQIVPPIADFIFDIDDPLDTVLLPGQSIYFTDLSQNMGTVDDEWLWEIIDATDHSTVVASSTLQNPVFTWEDLAYFFAAPSAEHWYDVQLTATNSEASDSITREFQFMSIPEPSTLLLLAPALLGFAGLLRRKLR